MGMKKDQLITPKCCKEVQEKQTVYLSFDGEAIYITGEGQAGYKPKWKSRCWSTESRCVDFAEIKFCPHCATPVPEIKKRDTKRKICSVTDGGYRCDTCKERLHACTCYMSEYAWEPVESKNDKPLGELAIELLNKIEYFFSIHSGYGNLKYIYTYMIQWEKTKSNFKDK